MKTFWLMAAVISLTVAAGTTARAISISSANTPGAHNYFDRAGGSSFTPDPSGHVVFLNEGTAFNDLGLISGVFTMGAVSSSSGTETASVTGTRSHSIAQGTGHNLTAGLSWVNMVQTGTGSSLDDPADVNPAGMTHAGANADLQALAQGNNLSDTLAFPFNPPATLHPVKTTVLRTSSSGSLIAKIPDDGSTAIMLGVALCAIGIYRKRSQV